MSDFEQSGGDEALLASVYLDGEATADERALVETAPDELDAVRQLSQVRTVLAATAPEAALSEREGHLAAALDVWDRMSDLERAGEVTPSDGIDAAAAAAVSTPISDTRRAREHRKRRPGGMTVPQWALGAAAGLVVIAGVGAVLLGVVSSDDGNTAEVAVEEVADDPASEVDALEAAEAAEVADQNVGDDGIPVETDLSDDAAVSGDALVADGSDASTGATASAASEADAPGSEQPAPAPEISLIEIESSEDLAVYGGLAVPAIESGQAEERDVDFEPVDDTCESRLGLEELLEPVFYQGVEAGVGVDLGNRVVYAYDRDDCTVIESAALPSDTRGDEFPADSSP